MEQVKGCRGCPSHANGAERLCSGQLPSALCALGRSLFPTGVILAEAGDLVVTPGFLCSLYGGMCSPMPCVLVSHACMSRSSRTQLGCLDRELQGPLPSLPPQSEDYRYIHATAPSFTWVWGSKFRSSLLTEPSPLSPSCRGDNR